MKTLKYALALLTLALSAFTTAPSAHAFYVAAEVDVNPGMVRAQVVNNSGQAMVCRVQVFGMRNDGFTQTAWAQLVVPGFGYEYAYVYTNYPFYFIDGRGTAYCSWY